MPPELDADDEANAVELMEWTAPVIRGLVAFQDGHFIHHCEVCGVEAGFGYGVALNKDELGRWFCATHRSEGRGRADG